MPSVRRHARRYTPARVRSPASPFGGRWRVPLSVAAVLVVSATVTLLVAERERHSSRSLHDQAAPPAAPVPLAHTGEPAAERSKTPARQFAEPGAPAPITSAAPRERESSRTAQPARKRARRVSSASARTVFECREVPRARAAERGSRWRRCLRGKPLPSRLTAARRRNAAETQQSGAAAPAGSRLRPLPRHLRDEPTTRCATRPGPRPTSRSPTWPSVRTGPRPRRSRAAGGAPAAPTAMQPSPRSAEQAAAPKAQGTSIPGSASDPGFTRGGCCGSHAIRGAQGVARAHPRAAPPGQAGGSRQEPESIPRALPRVPASPGAEKLALTRPQPCVCDALRLTAEPRRRRGAEDPQRQKHVRERLGFPELPRTCCGTDGFCLEVGRSSAGPLRLCASAVQP